VGGLLLVLAHPTRQKCSVDARSKEQPTHPLIGGENEGEVREWPNRAVSKTAVRATGPWVRIPPSPPDFNSFMTMSGAGGECLATPRGWDSNRCFEEDVSPSWGDRNKVEARGGLAP